MRSSGKNSAVTGGVAAAVIAMAAAFIAPWEGKRNYAYQDIVGVWTICYGSTNGVKKGDYKTDAECEALFKKEVAEYYARVESCMTNKSIPVSVQASLLELAYNVGTGAVCKSTMMKLANAGKYVEACRELDKWVKAGGKTVKGLVNRRNASEEMCVRDLAS